MKITFHGRGNNKKSKRTICALILFLGVLGWILMGNSGLVLAEPVYLAPSVLNLGNLTNYLFVFTNGSTDANWQGASKGFVGDVAVNGNTAKERTSGTVPYAGTIYTNDSTVGAWQGIVNDNAGQASSSTGQTALIASLEADLTKAMNQITALDATSGYGNRPATSLNGLNTQNGVNELFVINITSGFSISSKINITGDAGDIFVLRWDNDLTSAGYQGVVKFQSGGAIVPLGGLTPGNFINEAGDICSSGGGTDPNTPFPQGPYIGNNLIDGGADWNGGGFFTGYWLTTGDPNNKYETHSFSNAVFVGGWYTSTTKFSMTSGTSGTYYEPAFTNVPPTNPVPEPTAMFLFATGIIGVAGYVRKKL